MSLLYDEGQKAIASASSRVLEARVMLEQLLPLLELRGEYHKSYWSTAKEQGWTAVGLPEVYGGLDLTLVELGLIAHAVGRVTAGAPFLTSSYGVARAIIEYGSNAQKETWLHGLASGETIGVVAIGEEQSPLPVTPEVTFSNGCLNGIKPAVPGGLHADVIVVLASEGGKPVLALTTGEVSTRHGFNSFDNSRCTADLIFSDTSAEMLLSGSDAREAALLILAVQSVITAHEQTGGAEVLMEKACEYAKTRFAFGQPIGAFQSVKHRIAELYGLVEMSRANAIHAATREGKSDFILTAASARLSGIEAYDIASRDCVQIHGGIGVTWESGLHLHCRRARSLAVEQGNALFWEDILVKELIGRSSCSI